MFDYIIKVLIL